MPAPDRLSRFASALLAAFPARVELARAVQFGLNQNLNVLAPEPADLAATIFALLQWAEAHAQLAALLTAALAANPDSPPLRALREQWPALGDAASAGGPFCVPYYSNPQFVGRDAELARLHELLEAGQLPALIGTGGIGKTQLAVEYTHRARAAYPGGVFWLRMDPPAGITGQVAALAGPDGLNLPGWEPQGLEANLAMVRRTWDQPAPPRLLIFDNLEDPALLKEWRPKPGSGSRVLITSRYHVWAAHGGVTRLPLTPLVRTASRELLLGEQARAGDRPVADLLANPGTAAAVAAVCDELGDLPLALALARHILPERWCGLVYNKEAHDAARPLRPRGYLCAGAPTQSASRRYPLTRATGRHSTPVEVILRLLVVKHLDGWSSEHTEQGVAASLVLRGFCRIYWKTVPDDTTLIRWAQLIQPATLHALLDHVVEMACPLKVTHGRKLRLDGTVVETNIQAPTDSGLLHDGVRVFSRLRGAARVTLGETAQQVDTLFRDRTRSARRLAKQIIDTVRRHGEQAGALRKATYTRLIGVGEAMLTQAHAVGAVLREQGQAGAQHLAAQLEQFGARRQTVVAQTQRRVLHGEQVPASEKLVSLFEPETVIIGKGKLRKPTEYGRLIWLDEVEGGIIRRYEVLNSNPADSEQVQPSLDHHRQVFQRPPQLFTADRGCGSAAHETAAAAAGVRQICLPKPGAKSVARQEQERHAWFVRGRNWRAGIAGRIHGLKKRHKLDRCLDHGPAGM